MTVSYSPTSWAWSCRLDPISLLVLLALADMADDVGIIWDSPYRVLSGKTGLHKSTVGRKVRELGDSGYLMHSPGGAYRLMIGQGA